MSVGLSALDVGARGGVSTDLAEIAGAIEYYGFEPDSIECKKLNQGKSHQPWKSVTYLPTALADGDRDLKLTFIDSVGVRQCCVPVMNWVNGFPGANIISTMVM